MRTRLLSFLFGAMCIACADDAPDAAAKKAMASGSLYSLNATWTKQNGAKVEWKQSMGTARIVALGYATCKGVCPRIIADMQRIERAMTDEERALCRFTFVTLDPARDTPVELKALGERHKVDAAHWDLLAGSDDAVLELAVALGVRYDRLPNGIDFSHSYLIAVIGPDGRVLHKWTEPGEGVEPSLAALRRAVAK